MKDRGARPTPQPKPPIAGLAQAPAAASPKAVNGNLAVQTSLIQIFDEFTEVISGELKSMNLHDAGFPDDRRDRDAK